MTYNSTKLRLSIEQVRRWNSRLALLNKKSRLLCRECNEMKAVKTFLSLERVAVMQCGHRRAVPTAMTEQEQIELDEFTKTGVIDVQQNPRIAEWKIEEVTAA
jgi:hypothetical protein